MSDMYFDLFTRENSKAYEYGDLMSPVPRFPETLLATGSDTVYYASLKHMGIWQFDGSAWTQIHTSNPTAMTAGASVLYAVFSTGLYKYENGAWTLITNAVPTCVSASGTMMHYVDWVTGGGVYAYDETTDTATIIQPYYGGGAVPAPIVQTGNNIMWGYWGGGTGLYSYVGGTWTQLSTSPMQNMWGKDTQLFASFPSDGVWRWEGPGAGSWERISISTPTYCTMFGANYANYVFGGGSGLWLWISGTTFVQLTSEIFPYPIAGTTTTLYGHLTVGTEGLWYYNGSTWAHAPFFDTPNALIYPTPLAVTLANMRLSLKAGVAFVDFSAAGKLTPYIGGKLEIKDSAGKKLTGYIKAAGTGETLGSELIVQGDCASDNFGKGDGTTYDAINQEYDMNYVGVTYIYQNIKEIGKLYKSQMTVKNFATGSFYVSTSNGSNTGTYRTEDGTFVDYGTGEYNTYFYIIHSGDGAGGGSVDDISLKQVLTPSATGVTIVSEEGGSVQSWAEIETGFNYNDSSGYTCQIFMGGRIYMCSVPGTSNSYQPALNVGAGETTVDGTLTWMECTPAGVSYPGPLYFERQPKYGDYRRKREYIQAIERAAGGDVYVYTQDALKRDTRELVFSDMSAAAHDLLMDFIAILRGARFVFNFVDEDAVSHEALIMNSNDIMSVPVFPGYEGKIAVELLLIT